MTILWISLSALLFGFGIGGWLAQVDTPNQLHKPAMGGPKLRARMVIIYRLVALIGLGGWILVATLTGSNLWHWEGFVGMVVGVVIFNIIDQRHLTRHMG
jgi:hypothetical protein